MWGLCQSYVSFHQIRKQLFPLLLYNYLNLTSGNSGGKIVSHFNAISPPLQCGGVGDLCEVDACLADLLCCVWY